MKRQFKYSVVLILLVLGTLKAQNNKPTELEKSNMLYMLEEEKLAYDVYQHLNTVWNQRIFNNISQSELRHIEKMEELLAINKVSYSFNKESGKFTNNALQQLYNELTKKGSISLQDALEVGKLIEETDIKDLENAINNTQDAYAKEVYANLIWASKNHLNAFNRKLYKY